MILFHELIWTSPLVTIVFNLCMNEFIVESLLVHGLFVTFYVHSLIHSFIHLSIHRWQYHVVLFALALALVLPLSLDYIFVSSSNKTIIYPLQWLFCFMSLCSSIHSSFTIDCHIGCFCSFFTIFHLFILLLLCHLVTKHHHHHHLNSLH